ncbi:MAG: FAD:protein FMN transferase [Candidatus Neomarinimicrobiota bacterium]|nr:FAD:protein FMN transferase [Candidatus Neomarinimicrobiota bacterium]
MILVKKYSLPLWLFLFCLFTIFSTSCAEKEFHEFSGETMGTNYTIKYSATFSNQSNNKNKVNQVLDNINNQMSTYISDSEISRFNTFNDTTWFAISDEFAYVIVSSFKYYEISNGLYDITVMPLVNLWGFGPEIFLDIPSKTQIDSVLQFISQDLIEIDGNKIRKKDPRVQIDLSSIAKGYAVDQIIEILDYENIMVEIGGEVRTLSDGKLWRIGVSAPSIDNFNYDIEYIVPITNHSLATSGNYRNFYVDDNKNFYHHEINPLSGYPIQSNLGSISILTTTSCMEADGLSTALYMMDAKEVKDFLDKSNFEGLMIVQNEDGSFEKIVSNNFPKN